METVGIPLFSSTEAISPTDGLHIGQTGVSSTPSTWSSINISAAFSAVSEISFSGEIMMPIKLRCRGDEHPINPSFFNSRNRSRGSDRLVSLSIPL